MHDVQQFHRREIILRLAYKFKTHPEIVDITVIIDEEDGKHYMILLDGHRIRIKNDSYLTWDGDNNGFVSGKYEIFGVHTNGKASLRVRQIL